MSAKDVDVSEVNARLVEVILVVRGKVRPVRGPDRRRWRMRVDGDHVLTFRADAVVAATPLPRAAGPGQGRR